MSHVKITIATLAALGIPALHCLRSRAADVEGG